MTGANTFGWVHTPRRIGGCVSRRRRPMPTALPSRKFRFERGAHRRGWMLPTSLRFLLGELGFEFGAQIGWRLRGGRCGCRIVSVPHITFFASHRWPLFVVRALDGKASRGRDISDRRLFGAGWRSETLNSHGRPRRNHRTNRLRAKHAAGLCALSRRRAKLFSRADDSGGLRAPSLPRCDGAARALISHFCVPET